VRTGKLLCCNDTELDPLVDAQACRALGVRSIVAVPLCVQGVVGGILEVFSTSPRAFSDSDIEKLKQLAHFAIAAMWCPSDSEIAIPASDPCAETPNAVSSLTADPGKEESLPREAHPNSETQPARNFVKSLSWVIAGGPAAIALILLGVFIWGHRSKTPESPPQKAEVQPAQTQSLNATEPTTTDSGEGRRELDTSETSTSFDRSLPIQKHLSMAKADSGIDQPNDVRMRDFNAPPAVVSQNDSDIENAPPSADHIPSTQGSTYLSGVLTIPKSLPGPPLRFQGITPGRLEHKVEPIYPPQARMARVDGAVTLRATVGTDGKVQEVQIISGNPLLVQAAVNAVRQWRYKPYQLNNRPVVVQTDIVVTFRLP
jgi:protein TonB